MDSILAALPRVLFRWVHISSMTLLIGGLAYAWQVALPAVDARFRRMLYALLALVVGSGLYNLLTGPKHTREYHMVLGFKLLLVLHVLATSILFATSPKKGRRRAASIAVSGLAIVFLSAYLRYLSQNGQ